MQKNKRKQKADEEEAWIPMVFFHDSRELLPYDINYTYICL